MNQSTQVKLYTSHGTGGSCRTERSRRTSRSLRAGRSPAAPLRPVVPIVPIGPVTPGPVGPVPPRSPIGIQPPGYVLPPSCFSSTATNWRCTTAVHSCRLARRTPSIPTDAVRRTVQRRRLARIACAVYARVSVNAGDILGIFGLDKPAPSLLYMINLVYADKKGR